MSLVATSIAIQALADCIYQNIVSCPIVVSNLSYDHLQRWRRKTQTTFIMESGKDT